MTTALILENLTANPEKIYSKRKEVFTVRYEMRANTFDEEFYIEKSRKDFKEGRTVSHDEIMKFLRQ